MSEWAEWFEVSEIYFLNRSWKFQPSILKNEKVLFLKKENKHSQYQNKKALFTDSIFQKVLIWGFYLFVFNSHALTKTCFPGMYCVFPWECSRPKVVYPKGGIIRLWCLQNCHNFLSQSCWLFLKLYNPNDTIMYFVVCIAKPESLYT